MYVLDLWGNLSVGASETDALQTALKYKSIDIERSFKSTRQEMPQEKYLLTSECIARHQYSCKHHCFHEVLPGISATASHPR